jgi:hypothetical protein
MREPVGGVVGTWIIPCVALAVVLLWFALELYGRRNRNTPKLQMRAEGAADQSAESVPSHTLAEFAEANAQYRTAVGDLTDYLHLRSNAARDVRSRLQRRKLRAEGVDPSDWHRYVHGTRKHREETMREFYATYRKPLREALNRGMQLEIIEISLAEQLSNPPMDDPGVLWKLLGRAYKEAPRLAGTRGGKP